LGFRIRCRVRVRVKQVGLPLFVLPGDAHHSGNAVLMADRVGLGVLFLYGTYMLDKDKNRQDEGNVIIHLYDTLCIYAILNKARTSIALLLFDRPCGFISSCFVLSCLVLWLSCLDLSCGYLAVV
jgi:hypothetical protein